ncbi:Hypothetical_protein [Hexamita inflata]|uniref:Hypothetical_protein n=1 Tax=Hexamita inflata TaxID=28002 RepID=A0AA86NME3_9EUKA|nr:Hypothetical protein HINF_LOCUS9574 [Hexamita inflata]CAI9958835.1 Hypothetical protein HINF_LOCUS46480 [Hexamita inflata]
MQQNNELQKIEESLLQSVNNESNEQIKMASLLSVENTKIYSVNLSLIGLQKKNESYDQRMKEISYKRLLLIERINKKQKEIQIVEGMNEQLKNQIDYQYERKLNEIQNIIQNQEGKYYGLKVK